MIYFTSDLHFGHSNIIRYDNRPFNTVTSMDLSLIENWNKTVTPLDTTYILGDISWYGEARTIEILKKLNGEKILIKGNHDKVTRGVAAQFKEVTDYKELHFEENVHVVLCHYPIVFFNRRHYGAYMFYGHVHVSTDYQFCESYKREIREMGGKCNMFNVGCMLYNYTPQTFAQIIQKDKEVMVDDPKSE